MSADPCKCLLILAVLALASGPLSTAQADSKSPRGYFVPPPSQPCNCINLDPNEGPVGTQIQNSVSSIAGSAKPLASHVREIAPNLALSAASTLPPAENSPLIEAMETGSNPTNRASVTGDMARNAVPGPTTNPFLLPDGTLGVRMNLRDYQADARGGMLVVNLSPHLSLHPMEGGSEPTGWRGGGFWGGFGADLHSIDCKHTLSAGLFATEGEPTKNTSGIGIQYNYKFGQQTCHSGNL